MRTGHRASGMWDSGDRTDGCGHGGGFNPGFFDSGDCDGSRGVQRSAMGCRADARLPLRQHDWVAGLPPASAEAIVKMVLDSYPLPNTEFSFTQAKHWTSSVIQRRTVKVEKKRKPTDPEGRELKAGTAGIAGSPGGNHHILNPSESTENQVLVKSRGSTTP